MPYNYSNVMTVQIDRDKIIDFIFNELSLEEESLVIDAILSDKNLKKTFEEEKGKISMHCYADDALPPDERIEFEDKLKTDKQLSTEVKLLKEINNSIENLNLKETLDEAYESYISPKENSIPSTTLTYSINRKLKNWLVAASITILLILGGGITYHSLTRDTLENRLYAKYYEPCNYDDDYILNSSSLSIARQKYLDGEYMNALLLLKEQPSLLTIETERDFLIALSLLEIGNYDTALEYFKKVLLVQKEFEHIPQIIWYMGLCYLKMGNTEKAVETFSIIVNNNDYNYKKAKRILKKLRK